MLVFHSHIYRQHAFRSSDRVGKSGMKNLLLATERYLGRSIIVVIYHVFRKAEGTKYVSLVQTDSSIVELSKMTKF